MFRWPMVDNLRLHLDAGCLAIRQVVTRAAAVKARRVGGRAVRHESRHYSCYSAYSESLFSRRRLGRLRNSPVDVVAFASDDI